jgi:hypothetical protein
MLSELVHHSPGTQPIIEEKLVVAKTSSVSTSGAKCTQCGKSMRSMPMFLKNITCRDCYGMERYRRGETSVVGADRKAASSSAEGTVAS